MGADNSKIIGRRINAALANAGKKQKDLAAKIGVKDNVVSYFCSGARTPNLEQIIVIAKYLNTSSDYLLGLSAVQSPSIEMRAVCEYTGLSENAVSYLRILNAMKKDDEKPMSTRYSRIARINLLSELLERRKFDTLLANLVKYIRLMSTEVDLSYSCSAEYIALNDMAKKHGFEIALPDEQALALFSERITNLMRGILDDIVESKYGISPEEG